MKKFIIGLFVGVSITITGSVFADEGLQKIEAYLRPSLPITLNGQSVKLENAPVMYDGSTYLKLRDVSTLTGLQVNWNDANQTVELVDSKGVQPMDTTTPSPTTEPSNPNMTRMNEIRNEMLKLIPEIQDLESKVNKTTFRDENGNYHKDDNLDTYKKQISDKQVQLDKLVEEKKDIEAQMQK